MPRIAYECKVCGTERKQSNHWFVVIENQFGFHIYTWDWAVSYGELNSTRALPVCGHGCAHKLLDAFLSNPH